MSRGPEIETGESLGKPTRARYFVVLLAISLAVLSYVQRVAISQAAEPISHDLHLRKEQMGFIFGAFGLAYALFEIPMGLLGDRLGVRRVLTQIVLAWSVCTALTGAAWNVASMCVIRFLFGAGRGGMLSQPDADAERMDAGEGTRDRAGADVGVCALGWRDYAATGAAGHSTVRLAMGIRTVRGSGGYMVRGVPVLVPRRSGRTSQRERGGTRVAGGFARAHHASGGAGALAFGAADAAGA